MTEQVALKQCRVCFISKEMICFHVNRSSKDGFRNNCKDCHSKSDKNRYSKNKDVILKKNREYYSFNRQSIIEQKTAYCDELLRTDASYRMKHNLRARFRSAIKKNSKKGSAVKDLGCEVVFFTETYLPSLFYSHPVTQEPMTWASYGHGCGKWQIDHIKALCLFDLSDPDQLLNAVNYRNLQPIWHEDHVIKTTKDNLLKKIESCLNGKA